MYPNQSAWGVGKQLQLIYLIKEEYYYPVPTVTVATYNIGRLLAITSIFPTLSLNNYSMIWTQYYTCYKRIIFILYELAFHYFSEWEQIYI